MELVLMALILAAVLAAQYFVYKKYALRGVSYTLTLSKTEVFEGDEFEAVEEIENAKWLPLPWVRTEISCSRRLSFVGASQETADKTEQRGLVAGIFVLRGRQKCRRVWRVRCEKRGVFAVNDVSVSASDLFGLCRPTMLIKTEQRVRVLPIPAEIECGELSREAFIGDIAVRRFVLPDPFMISGAREYTGREPMSRIHWAQTARTGRPMVYSSEFTTERAMLVVMNMQRSFTDERRRLSVTDIEAQIKAAAFMLDVCRAARTPCALCANTVQPLATPCAEGYAHTIELLRILAELKNGCGRHIDDYIETLDISGYTDVVLITAFVSERTADFLRAASQAGKGTFILTTGADETDFCESRHIPRKLYPPEAGDDE